MWKELPQVVFRAAWGVKCQTGVSTLEKSFIQNDVESPVPFDPVEKRVHRVGDKGQSLRCDSRHMIPGSQLHSLALVGWLKYAILLTSVSNDM